jgi:hypothetical protein
MMSPATTPIKLCIVFLTQGCGHDDDENGILLATDEEVDENEDDDNDDDGDDDPCSQSLSQPAVKHIGVRY